MAGLRRMGNQLVGLAALVAIIILGNVLSALGAPGIVAWGGAIVLLVVLVAGANFGRRRLKLWRDKPLAQWEKLDSKALALQKRAEHHSDSNEGFAQAEGLYKQALEVAEASARPLLIATASNNLASLYCDQRRFEDAEPLFQRALELREAHAGPDDQSTVKSIDRLSGLYAELDRWADVERMQRRALESYRRAAPNSPGVAQTLTAIAVACRRQDKIDEADRTYSEAFAAVTSEKSDDAGLILNDWAYLKEKQGKVDEAEQMYKRAIAIQEKGVDHMGLATTLDNLADLQVHAGRAAEGALTSERWLQEMRKSMILGSQGSYHSLYTFALEHHAERLEAGGRAADAEAARGEAATIRAKHPEDAAEYANLAAAAEKARLSRA